MLNPKPGTGESTEPRPGDGGGAPVVVHGPEALLRLAQALKLPPGAARDEAFASVRKFSAAATEGRPQVEPDPQEEAARSGPSISADPPRASPQLDFPVGGPPPPEAGRTRAPPPEFEDDVRGTERASDRWRTPFEPEPEPDVEPEPEENGEPGEALPPLSVEPELIRAYGPPRRTWSSKLYVALWVIALLISGVVGAWGLFFRQDDQGGDQAVRAHSASREPHAAVPMQAPAQAPVPPSPTTEPAEARRATPTNEARPVAPPAPPPTRAHSPPPPRESARGSSLAVAPTPRALAPPETARFEKLHDLHAWDQEPQRGRTGDPAAAPAEPGNEHPSGETGTPLDGPRDADWMRVSWGMDAKSVLKALSPFAVPVHDATLRRPDRLTPSASLSDANLGSHRFAVRFLFDQSDALAAIELRVAPWNKQAFDEMVEWLAARHGLPLERHSPSNPGDEQSATWLTRGGLIELHARQAVATDSHVLKLDLGSGRIQPLDSDDLVLTYRRKAGPNAS